MLIAEWKRVARKAWSVRLALLREAQSSSQRDITALRGKDDLHDEQIRALRRDLEVRNP